MKRTIFVLLTMLVVFVAVFAVLVLRLVPKVKATVGCSNRMLLGNYGLVAPGFYGVVPANFSMLVKFDGKGGFNGSSLNVVNNGVPDGGNPGSFTGGTYTVLSDCTCTFATPPLPAFGGAIITAYGIAVDTGCDEVAGNLSSNADNITGTFDAKRVAVGGWGFFK